MTASERFSPETTHLIACLRGALGTAAWPRRAEVEWSRFVREVDRHRVGAFLYARRPPTNNEPWPEPVAKRLHVIASNTLQQSIRQAALQQQLLQRLREHRVSALAIKGLVLSQQLYGGLGRRHAGDIDLLIRPQEVAVADAILQENRLRRTRPDFPLTPHQMRAYLRVMPDFEYIDEPTRQRVELLWRAEYLDEGDVVDTPTVTVRVGEQSVPTLMPELNALYLFEHGAKHGWFRLFWLVDIALLFQTAGSINWSNLMERARKNGNERAVLQGASLAAEVLGGTLPHSLLPSDSERLVVQALTAAARWEIARPVSTSESVALWAQRARYRVRLQRRLSGKIRVLSPHLFTPESWRMCRLPDWLFWAYPVATPFLWVWRRIRKRPAPPGEARLQAT